MNIVRTLKPLALVRGIWTADAHAPVLVSDPAKARHLLGLPSRKAAKAATLPHSFIVRTLPQLKPSIRRELEKLLSGGGLKWHEAWTNIVVNQGLDDLLDVTLSGGTQDTTWFVGLTDGTPTVNAADTLASHAGWVEVEDYDEFGTGRVAWVDGGVSSQSVSNSGSVAVFTIDATVTIGGAFLAGVVSGTSGRLYAAGAFTAGDKLLNDNDTLSVTATFTTAAA